MAGTDGRLRELPQSLETLILAAAVYWMLTIIFSFFQDRLETPANAESDR